MLQTLDGRPTPSSSSADKPAKAATGWRGTALAFAAGALAALAMAPLHAAPVLWLCLPLLVWLLDGTRGPMSAALRGWSFGFGYFLVGLHWIGEAFLVDAETFGWMIPFALVGLSAGLALFPALGCALARAFWSGGPGRIAALAFGLGASEWLRGHVLTGFPWNAFGQALSATIETAQAASVVGLHGLTILVILIFAAPAAAFGAKGRLRGRKFLFRLALGPAAFGLVWVCGAARLSGSELTYSPGVLLRIVQPNLDQREKLRPERREEVMESYLRLSRSAGFSGITHLIWPESAFPFILESDIRARGQIADLMRPGLWLLTGAARLERQRATPGSVQNRASYYNSFYVIDGRGEIAGTYDKVHLVPFGEYLPFQKALESVGLEQLTRVRGGFEAGTRRMTLAAGPAPSFSPLICYEIVFPGEAAPQGGERPSWFVNITNDSWFGRSFGPHQHLDQARLRAIEQGSPVARAAMTGVSAMIDPYGRLLASLPLGSEGVLDSGLPAPISSPPFARFGWIMPASLLFLAGCGAAATRSPGKGI